VNEQGGAEVAKPVTSGRRRGRVTKQQEPGRSATFAIDFGKRVPGSILRLSLVGAEIEAMQVPPVDARVVVWVELVKGEGKVGIRGRVQWTAATRFGVLFGPLGARETYALIRAARGPKAEDPGDPTSSS
jgi:hypothetical protein